MGGSSAHGDSYKYNTLEEKLNAGKKPTGNLKPPDGLKPKHNCRIGKKYKLKGYVNDWFVDGKVMSSPLYFIKEYI